jgi:dGTP triphosphohydrolase
MDLADDIAYSTYDLEDAFKNGFLSPISMMSLDNGKKRKIAKEVSEKMNHEYDDLERFPVRLNRRGFPNRLGSDSCFWPAKGAGVHGQILIR